MEKLLTINDLLCRWQCDIDLLNSQIKKGLKVIALSSKELRFDLRDVIFYEEQLKKINNNIISFEGNLIKNKLK